MTCLDVGPWRKLLELAFRMEFPQLDSGVFIYRMEGEVMQSDRWVPFQHVVMQTRRRKGCIEPASCCLVFDILEPEAKINICIKWPASCISL